MPAMKRLYSAGTALEAHDLRLYLAAHGIEAQVFGDNNAWEGPFAFTPDSAPGVFVREADLDRAGEVLDEFLDRPRTATVQGSWVCPSCQEAVEAQSDECWNCQSPRGDTPIENAAAAATVENEYEKELLEDRAGAPVDVVRVGASSPVRSTTRLWVEVVVVLVLTQPLFQFQSVPWSVIRGLGLEQLGITWYLPFVLLRVFLIVVVLAAIRLSREPWSNFGISEPDSLDLVRACVICLAHLLVTSIGRNILRDVLTSMYGRQYVERISHLGRLTHHGQGWEGFFALLALAISVGLAEELVSRGYLIPRLERLLRRTWAAVLISAVVFAMCHWSRGIFSVWNAFLVGLVYGVAFAWSRRLWPVVIAHSVYDFSAFLYMAP
jgi:membrane protease YdiL (CAAX protease family)